MVGQMFCALLLGCFLPCGSQDDELAFPPLLAAFDERVFSMFEGSWEWKRLGITNEEHAQITAIKRELLPRLEVRPGEAMPDFAKEERVKRDKAGQFMEKVAEVISEESYRRARHEFNFQILLRQRDAPFGSEPTGIMKPLMREKLSLSKLQVDRISELIEEFRDLQRANHIQFQEDSRQRWSSHRTKLKESLPMDVSAKLHERIGEPIKWSQFGPSGLPFLNSGPGEVHFEAPGGSSWLAIGDGYSGTGPLPSTMELYQYMVLASETLRENLRVDEDTAEEIISQIDAKGGGVTFDAERNRNVIEQLLEGERTLPDEYESRLDRDQLHRICQIELQLRLAYVATFGLLNPRMIEELELSEKFVEELKTLSEDMKRSCEKAVQDYEDEGRRQEGQFVKDVISVLTPRQREIYERYVGDSAEWRTKR